MQTIGYAAAELLSVGSSGAKRRKTATWQRVLFAAFVALLLAYVCLQALAYASAPLAWSQTVSTPDRLAFPVLTVCAYSKKHGGAVTGGYCTAHDPPSPCHTTSVRLGRRNGTCLVMNGDRTVDAVRDTEDEEDTRIDVVLPDDVTSVFVVGLTDSIPVDSLTPALVGVTHQDYYVMLEARQRNGQLMYEASVSSVPHGVAPRKWSVMSFKFSTLDMSVETQQRSMDWLDLAGNIGGAACLLLALMSVFEACGKRFFEARPKTVGRSDDDEHHDRYELL